MKIKSFLIIAISFFFFGCNDEFQSQEDLSQKSARDNELRAGTTPSFIEQLSGIPVNIIISPGIVSANKMYLAAQRTGESNKAWLWVQDDASGRQRFYIEKHSIVNGVQYYTIKAQGGGYKGKNYVGDEPYGNYNYPVLWKDSDLAAREGRGSWHFILNDQINKFRIQGPTSKRYLQAKGFNDKNLLLSTNLPNNGYADWSIEPINELVIESISYTLTSSNNLISKPEFVVNAEVDNRTNVQQTMTLNYSTTATETSGFSETKGYSLTTSQTFSTGIPIILDGKLNVSSTTSASWSYSKSQTKSDTRSYNFPIVVPANTKYRAKAIVSMYQANAKYIAKCKVKNLNRTILLEGTWTGILAGEIKYEIYDANNALRKSFIGKPSSIIKIN